jgi:integrase
MIENYKRFRVKQPTPRGPTTKPKTINKELSYLSSMCTWMALPENNMSLPLPFIIKGFPASKTEPPTPQVLTHSAMIRFIRAAERETFRPIFAIFYYTGMRKSEVLNLRAEQVNLNLNTISVTVKGGKIKTYPIHRKIRVYLRKRRKVGTYLFTNPKTNRPWVDLDCAISRAAKKTKISQHVYLHLFRHTFGVQCILSGIGLRSTQLLIGHESSQTTEKYTRLTVQHLAAEIDKFGGGAVNQAKVTQQLLQDILGALHLNKKEQLIELKEK